MSLSIAELVIIIIKIIIRDKVDAKVATQEVANRYNVAFVSLWNELPSYYK